MVKLKDMEKITLRSWHGVKATVDDVKVVDGSLNPIVEKFAKSLCFTQMCLTL